ncbi:N-acetyltransferase [Alkalihalobacillus deserti]|uniref:N-acetyltransferase n=1 Tax=Alkalihalobacillus deserti TaxID=2879466 RepID=UPI001D151DD2|nr:N-acetyltransferase [Alkalihalobacillus deserti]
MNSIDPTAQLDSTVKVGHFTVIEKDVKIAANVMVGNRVTIYEGTIIGEGTTIADGAVLGKPPKPAKTSTVKMNHDLKPLTIGKETTFGANCVVYRGSQIGDSCLIADLASIRENVEIADLVVVGQNVVVENFVKIGQRTKIQSNSYITAYSTLEDHVFIAPCVTTTNDNFMGRTEERFDQIKGATIKKGARVGGASILLPGVTIAEETFIAAGALITKNTTPKTVVKGFPAKVLRDVPERELLDQ